MRSISTALFALVIFSGVFNSALAQSPSIWSPDMQVKVKAVGGPRVSPDGSRVVYTINEAVMTAEKSEFVTQIWLASADGKDNFQVTFGEKSSTNPKWSPDGKWIAFTSNRKDNKDNKDNKNNLYILRVNGGEAEPVTEVKSSVSDFEWSPDGRWIAYASADAKSDDEDKNDKGKNDFRWVDENFKLARLYVIPVARDANGKREARKLTNDNRHVNGFNWSPDGRNIVFSHVKSPVANDWPSSDVAVVEVSTARVMPFAATQAAESSPSYSPDGKWIAMLVSDLPVRWAQSGNITIFPAAGGPPKQMPISHDGQPNIIGWSPDSTKIYFSEAKGTGTSVSEANVAAGTITQLHNPDAVVSAINISDKSAVFGMVIQTADRPPEAFVTRFNDAMPTQVSWANAELAKMPVGRTEVVRWKSTDGREIEGLLTYPVGYTAGTKVPLILNIHGGPAGVFQHSYIGGRGSYPIASFAARGIAVLRPNPRGSSGYGTEFRRANLKDWGVGDYDDLMTGVDKVIAMGVADADKLGVMGWSYGGYMTSTIITKTKRFKAASAGAPVTNLMSFTGTADIPSFIPDYFGGEFWDNPDLYRKHSAMFNIKGATTPTLIQHGEADVRVPISQGYELYNALKSQGVPTRMIVLPRQPHGPNEPKMQVAAMQSNLDWFEKYLGAAAAQK
ncbi:MAG: S9 family peptidase [Acidobacteriota bacterium]|nr:S9 family peptidase [Acidobacteriota bacterium]